jgi:glutaredoxin
MQHCPNCDASKRLLNSKNLPFTAKDVSEEGVLEELKALKGKKEAEQKLANAKQQLVNYVAKYKYDISAIIKD